MTDNRRSRRALLRSGAAAGTLLLAGCSGNESTGTPTPSGLFGRTDPGTTTGDGRQTDDGPTGDTDRPSVVVGQRVLRESIGFLVEGTTRYGKLPGPGQAPDGREYLVVVLSVKNRGDEVIEMGDLNAFRLIDGDGTTRERVDLVTQTGSQFTEGLLVPGETIRGFVAFEVASDSTGWTFVVDIESLETDLERLSVDLDADPQQPDGLFRQSLRVPVNDVGDSVTAADLTVTVSEVRTADSVGRSRAGEGQEFLLPTVRVDNGKDRTAYLGLTGQTLLTGPRGTPRALDLGAQQQLEGSFPLNPNVPSGEHVEGEIPYLVDAGDSPLYFAFDFTTSGAEQKSIWQLR
ncbi:DUF4352 domain-containing protein [Halorientalis regularis]|uniref:DUF4352 domain-containing protein n=1 Tax=Halorientalis regularis TaxID=660518 RepID=A0A1G7L3C2_9EURY|nr:DUF4352 domain-containing protein [Halorientalis regularis]SDF44052.1 protein of unknown function [Halorientalis regularis]